PLHLEVAREAAQDLNLLNEPQHVGLGCRFGSSWSGIGGQMHPVPDEAAEGTRSIVVAKPTMTATDARRQSVRCNRALCHTRPSLELSRPAADSDSRSVTPSVSTRFRINVSIAGITNEFRYDAMSPDP